MPIKKLKAPKLKKLKPEIVKYNHCEPEPYDDRPRISFKETEIPEVADWKIGETYTVLIKCEMQGSSIMDYGNDKGKVRAEFKIVGVGLADEEVKK